MRAVPTISAARCTRTTAFVIAGALAACASPAQHESDAPEIIASSATAEIEALLRSAAAAWNRGDLDAFMRDYEPGEGTTYIGGSGILRGPSAIREAYAPRFRPGAVRDSLSFERLEVHPLAPDIVYAIAYYVLSRSDSITARGPTSLVFRRSGGRWRIAHDHSS